MDNYINNRHKEIIWNLLVNPADAGHDHLQTLERLVQENPQSGVLQVLLARADNHRDLAKAAVYFNPQILNKVINNQGDLPAIEQGSIIQNPVSGFVKNHVPVDAYIENIPYEAATEPQAMIDTPAGLETQTSVEPGSELEQPGISWENAFEPEPEYIEGAEFETRQPEGEQGQPGEEITEPVTEAEPEVYLQTERTQEQPVAEILNETSAKEDWEEASSFKDFKKEQEREYFRQDIEDDIYDEIVSIEDISFHALNTFAEQAHSTAVHPENLEREEQTTVPEPILQKNTAGEAPVSFNADLNTNQPQTHAIATQDRPSTENQDVSRYHDDTLPYSFMWWLNKTRKEHAGTFQPYAVNRLAAAVLPVVNKNYGDDELQQQYNENIFSTTSVNSIGSEPPQVYFDHKKKEDVIIERFIHTEPQIKPLAADKLDNENKARQSAEDNHELVTETLARIYTEQMLYPKAIATYQKLMLKFPEKNAYFAAQIQLLEKRTN